MRAWGSPRNLGRPVVSISESPVWGTGGTKAPGLLVRAFLCRWEQSQKREGWYYRAERKLGGTGGRVSEHLHSTGEAGEVFPGRSGGGKGDAGLRNRWRATWRKHWVPIACQRNFSG